MSAALQQLVERRIQTYRRWSRQPDLAPSSLCDPDPRYGLETCQYSPLEADLRQLESYCETRRYDTGTAHQWTAEFAGEDLSDNPSDDIPF